MMSAASWLGLAASEGSSQAKARGGSYLDEPAVKPLTK